MTYSALELYCSEKLGCGTGDLWLLDHIYSDLVEDGVGDIDYIIKEAETLNDLMYRAYDSLKDEYINVIEEHFLGEEDDRQFVADESGEFDFTEEELKDIRDKVEELKEEYPFCNCSDTHLPGDMGQTVDWDKDVRDNVASLISYWIGREVIYG